MSSTYDHAKDDASWADVPAADYTCQDCGEHYADCYCEEPDTGLPGSARPLN